MDFNKIYREGKKVAIDIEFNNKIRTLPVNPESLTIKRNASNNNINIVGLGPATRKGHPGLITMQIKSFFPSPYSPYFIYDVTPEDYINFIYEIWETENTNNKVAKLITRGLDKNFSMWFVIESFDYEYKGGDLDVGYNLSLKEYVPYGARIETTPKEGMGNDRPVSTAEVVTPTNKTYVVSSGDSLWAIAKRSTGDGNNWKVLYELNKDIVGENPNTLTIGTTLVLPENWNVPVKATNSSGKKTTASKTSPTTSSTPATTKELENQEEGATYKGSSKDLNALEILSKATAVGSEKPTAEPKKLGYYQSYWQTEISRLSKVNNQLEAEKGKLTDLKQIKTYNEYIAKNSKQIRNYEDALAAGWTQMHHDLKGNLVWYKDASGVKHNVK